MVFLTFLHNWCFKNSTYLSAGLSIMTVNISWNFKERMVHINSLFSSDFQWLFQIPAGDLCRRKIVFSSFAVVKDFWNVTIFGTGASSIPESDPEATPFATPTHFLPPGNPYCVSTVVEFLITYINKLYDYNTDSVCALSTSPCWAVSKSGDNRVFRYA